MWRLHHPNLAALVAATFFASPALASGFSEGGNGSTAPNSSIQAGATVVASCGSQTYVAGTLQPSTIDTTGTLCSTGASGTASTETHGSAVGGAIAAKSDLAGCNYNSTPPTLSNTQQDALQCDSAGNLMVTGVGVAQASTTSGQTISPLGCRTLNAPAADTTAKTNMPTCALSGALIVYPYSNPENLVSGVTAAMTGTTTTSLVAAPASGLRNYITHIACTNSHATVGTFVIVQDGSGGTTFYEGYAAAVGGGFSFALAAPLRQPTTATALYVADVTTGANVICSASGFKAP